MKLKTLLMIVATSLISGIPGIAKAGSPRTKVGYRCQFYGNPDVEPINE